VIGRRRQQKSAVQVRLDEARASIRRHNSTSPVLDVLDDVERSLESAVQDCVRLEQTIEQLNPTKATQDLKLALRMRPNANSSDSEQISALRRRHDTVHALMNRLSGLRGRMDRTLIDVDTMVAQSVTAVVASDSYDRMLERQLGQLTDDAAGLTKAHQELDLL
jgi:hypothetical protein